VPVLGLPPSSGLVEQGVERTHLDGVASVAQQWEAEVLLDGLQQGVVVGEDGVDAVPDAPGYHDHRNAARAVEPAAAGAYRPTRW